MRDPSRAVAFETVEIEERIRSGVEPLRGEIEKVAAFLLEETVGSK